MTNKLSERLIIRDLGVMDYTQTWQDMQHFTAARTPDTADELWTLQHPPVFTQGQAGKPQHLLAPGDIPVIQVDRGGQVTYHGPGQLVVYLLLDIARKGIGSKQLVNQIEQALVATLDEFGIAAAPREDAPGVYTAAGKIASLGLRIRRGCSFHGLALNVDMDLEPFRRINPCGFAGMPMTHIRDYLNSPDLAHICQRLTHQLVLHLGYTQTHHATDQKS